jgi:hypothetical protein
MRQSPDFRLLPLLPELLDRLPLREQVMDSFNQQYIVSRFLSAETGLVATDVRG